MNDDQLDALLSEPLPERDIGLFSVELMERIAHEQARPARIAAWLLSGVLTVIVAVAVLLLAQFTGRNALPLGAMPALLLLLTGVLSYAVLRSVRE